MKYNIVVLTLLVLVGCSQNQPKKKVDSRIKRMVYLDINPGEPPSNAKGDLRLSVKDTTQNDSATNYEVVALNGDQEIGLMISIPKDTGKSPFANGFTLKSIGEPSNHLLDILTFFYKQKLDGPSTFVDEVKAHYVDIRKLAKSYKEGEVSQIGGDYKLFFDNNDGEEPAELYINVDSAANWIEIKEKDPIYRAGVIKALTRKKG
jgi:hypothetical protein